jgi:hypothetical protein
MGDICVWAEHDRHSKAQSELYHSYLASTFPNGHTRKHERRGSKSVKPRESKLVEQRESKLVERRELSSVERREL